ncbi:MAG TPA: rhodanese-like domain-containing protein [Oligoflexia bacterium]|nr:rhodanese-like domain-containing protein [Oligoflexia bacterium]HMP49010.1 rhodanese-like domain-containing protein [Oligoflexia bacterium]
MSKNFDIVSFYRFIKMDDSDLSLLRAKLEVIAKELDICGLIIIAPEGLNGTVAAPEGMLTGFTDFLVNEINSGDWKFKFSTAKAAPFKRFSLKERNEIVSSGYPELFPDANDESHLSPMEWHNQLAELDKRYKQTGEKNYFLIDVRNDYEVALGTFRGAIDPMTSDFKEFPDFVESSGIPKDSPVYMCCTGGIRCEKAYLEMKQKGYEKVYQLDGGILRYLEEYPDGLFQGECFVFDDRVALDSNLNPSSRYSLCPHCGDPAEKQITCPLCSKEMRVCDSCIDLTERNTCSKNCRYHYSLRLSREQNEEVASIGNPISKQNEVSHSDLKTEKFLVSGLILILLSILPNTVVADTSSASCKPGSGHSCTVDSPEKLVMGAINMMKTAGNPSPIVDFIDWDLVYSETPPKNREIMKVKSPEDLSAFYRKVLMSPSSEIGNLLESKLEGNVKSGDDKNLSVKAQQVLAKLRGRLEEKEKEVSDKLANSEYKIDTIKSSGDSALVKLEQTYKGETKSDTLKLHKKNGIWYLSSLSSVLSGSGALTAGKGEGK